jgi:Zn-finger nucleic acid-binding protein
MEKPSRNEDEYFARENAERLKETRARLEAEHAEAERRSHIMKCPHDGYDLAPATFHGISVERCSHCGGVWFDRAELAAIELHEDRPGLLGRFFGDLLTGIRTSHMPHDSDENLRHEPGNPLS